MSLDLLDLVGLATREPGDLVEIDDLGIVGLAFGQDRVELPGLDLVLLRDGCAHVFPFLPALDQAARFVRTCRDFLIGT